MLIEDKRKKVPSTVGESYRYLNEVATTGRIRSLEDEPTRQQPPRSNAGSPMSPAAQKIGKGVQERRAPMKPKAPIPPTPAKPATEMTPTPKPETAPAKRLKPTPRMTNQY